VIEHDPETAIGGTIWRRMNDTLRGTMGAEGRAFLIPMV
jgi:hypothetical protein